MRVGHLVPPAVVDEKPARIAGLGGSLRDEFFGQIVPKIARFKPVHPAPHSSGASKRLVCTEPGRTGSGRPRCL